MTEDKTKPTKPPATAKDLLDALGENIARLRDGDTTPAIANAIVNSSAGMLRIVKYQMDYAKATNRIPNIPMLLTSDE